MKKILIVLLATISLTLLALALFQRGNSGEDPVTPPDTTAPVVNQRPEQTTYTQQEIVTFVDDELDVFQQQYAGKYGWQNFTYKGVRVPVSTGMAALGATVPNELERLLKKEDWGVYSCATSVDQPAFVLRIELAVLPNYAGDLFADVRRFMREWESTLVQDTQHILFPGDLYGEVVLNGSFIDSPIYQFEQVRQATVSIDGSNGMDIAYQIVGDFILVGNNIDCIVTNSETLVDLVL